MIFLHIYGHLGNVDLFPSSGIELSFQLIPAIEMSDIGALL